MLSYTPDTKFNLVIDNAFGVATLLEVLKQGGGGLAASGRHTVVGLLNPASLNVSYPLTVNEVVSQFMVFTLMGTMRA